MSPHRHCVAVPQHRLKRHDRFTHARDLQGWLDHLPPEAAQIMRELLSQENPDVSDRIRTAWEQAVQAKRSGEQ